MINDIPFPIPFSVILSPSHMTNMVPEMSMITEEIMKKVVGEVAAASKGEMASAGKVETDRKSGG